MSKTREAAFERWNGSWANAGAFAGAKVAYCELPDGAHIELLPTFQTGLTHLGMSVMGSDCTEYEDITVLLTRDQVERLRDALSEWLDRGAL